MAILEAITNFLNTYVVSAGIDIGGERLPFMVLFLLGTGVFLTFQLGFIQLRRLGHGFAVTTGRYDDPNEPGDVSHFQALTTALSATVGIGNIAGVAIALHWGGPGALFWMWMTAFLGMATKFCEVTLAQHYRDVDVSREHDAHKWEGSVSGGPMYYIERGLGRKWKPVAILFALILAFTAFLTGNGIQANTVADTLQSTFGVQPWVSGLITSAVVAAVILGGITRIGAVTGILAPVMAGIYVLGALTILILNFSELPAAFALIFREAFNPQAGVAGTGIGAILLTMMWGVRRGLFSNEAGQGSAPIAHAAAKTDEPVSEGVVALLEPFIDTIVICTMTGLVIVLTGVWNDRIPTEITLGTGDISYVQLDAHGTPSGASAPTAIEVQAGEALYRSDSIRLAWHDVPVDGFYTDPALSQPFSGHIDPVARLAIAGDGTEYGSLFGRAVESGAPMTMEGFRRGLSPLGEGGHYIVVICVLLFAVSTAISWSYYGDRCANYVFGAKAVLPYKLMYVVMHFLGAVAPLAIAWDLGDAALAIVIIPNLIALIALSPKVKQLTQSYFERRPWESQPKKHSSR